MSVVIKSTTKRALELTGEEPPARRSRLSQTLLESELDSLKSELEHERSLRELDQRRAQQALQRLERQVQFATEEAEEVKQLMEEFRKESEARIQDLREARADTLAELRDCELRLQEASYVADQEHDRTLAEEQKDQLRAQLQARSEEVQALRERLQEVTKEALRLQESNKSNADNEDKDPFPAGQSSPAPKAVLKELNRVRIELAESERRYRQLCRKSEDWQQKAKQYVHHKESARTATARVAKLEGDLREAHKELESLRATNSTWEDFAKELGKALSLSGDVGGPPEVATVLRHLQRHIKHAKTAEDGKASLEEEAESFKRQIAALEKQSRDTSTLLVRAKRESSELEKKVDSAQQRIRTLESQEGIWQRESESLRELINTFDAMIPGASSTSDSAATTALVIGLATAKAELKVVTDDRDMMNGKLRKLQVEKEDLQKEHDRVLDKFSKLRDALMEERAKADKAQDRAIDAELLAGKGAFNPDQSRALHMDKNPLIDAIRERYQAEIYSLRRKLEQMTGQKIPEGVLPSPEGVDPNKLHQRLKESFKEQINMFREGVYLITGYKIDMIHTHNGSSFRVRSVYAEREEDYLEFYWPKGVKEPKALDLGASAFAKVLSTTHSYQYLKKYDSCPAFVASAQLSQFEKCTIVQFG